MPRFYALTGPGCLPALQKELQEMDIGGMKPYQAGVMFESNWAGAYRMNLRSRTSSRIIHILGEFRAKNGEELYSEVRKFQWDEWIEPDQYIFVDASTHNSELKDQRFIAMKTKDAVVDCFRDKYGIRPSVDPEDAELKIWIRFHKNEALIGIDTSGEPLFKRGYRAGEHPAPIKEHVAASLLTLTGWDKKSPIIDPMCGSGTFLLEGALMAMNIYPGTLRSSFDFQKWKNFDKASWEAEVESAMGEELENLDFKFYGFDIKSDAVKAAYKNIKSAGFEDFIEVKRSSVDLFEPPVESGLIITNPPYGERLSKDEDLLKDVYRDLGFALRSRFKGWTAWVLSPRRDLINLLEMKPSERYEVWNGPLPCEFLKFEVFKNG